MSLPRMFLRPRLLIVGCGDVGLRVVARTVFRWQVVVLTSQRARVSELRRLGVTPLVGNLDDPSTLSRLAGLANAILYLAPPPPTGGRDTRLAACLQALSRRSSPGCLVYASTTGVYGDAQGEWVTESRPVAPQTERAARRCDAEARVRWWGRSSGARVSILRIPGIYACDREGGHPQDRVLRGAPVLRREDDVFTNHIHADDLARACVAALHRGRPQRAYQICDDAQRLMGDHFDAVADRLGLPHPDRISREEAATRLSPMQMSFLGESRRLSNTRMKKELRLQLLFPDVLDALPSA